MLRFIQALNRNLVIVIPVSMLAGYIFGLSAEAGPLRKLIPVFTFIMVFPMMVTLQYRKAFTRCSWLTQGLGLFINFVAAPLAAFFLGKAFFADHPYLALGLLMAALIPASGMTVSWTGIARGNVEVAVKMMIVGLTFGSLLAPFYVKLLLGAGVRVQVSHMIVSVLQIVFLPMAAGFVTRQVLAARNDERVFEESIMPFFPPFTSVGVIGIVFTALAMRAKLIAGRPLLLVEVLVPVAIFYTVLLALGAVAGRWLLPRADAVALLYGTALRNLAIALAITVSAFGKGGSDAALVIAAAFIVQTQLATWSAKYVDRIFGSVAQTNNREP
jgi:ACR3 family arsenite efflux pump ArsB